MAASRGGAPRIQAFQSRAGWQTRRAAGDVLEELGTLGSGAASLFHGLMLPRLLAHRSISRLRKECRHPFREPLHFIVIAVMSVMVVTPPLPMGFCVTLPLLDPSNLHLPLHSSLPRERLR
jgi:hypothetical protein